MRILTVLALMFLYCKACAFDEIQYAGWVVIKTLAAKRYLCPHCARPGWREFGRD